MDYLMKLDFQWTPINRSIAPFGEVGITTTGGAGQENTTVLVACNGAGRVLDPLIIF